MQLSLSLYIYIFIQICIHIFSIIFLAFVHDLVEIRSELIRQNIQHRNLIRFSIVFSGRILYDVPCKVCCDHSSGKHYGIFACDGCAGFFKRSIRRSRNYVCKAKTEGNCVVDKTHRNQCRACRLRKCFKVGMNKDAVQHERGPRNSTLRRQMAMFKDGIVPTNEVTPFQQDLLFRSLPIRPQLIPPFVLDLSRTPSFMDTPTYTPPVSSPPHNVSPPAETPVESICETAAQLLFMNMRWIKSQCELHQISMTDQLQLLEESWLEFFLIGSAQYLMSFSFNPLLCAYEVMNSNRNTPKQNAVIGSEVNNFQSILFKLAQMNVDEKEYNCLRAIVLYKNRMQSSSGSSCGSPCSSNEKSLQEPNKTMKLHDDAIQTLATYISISKPTQPLRYKNLMIILDQLKTVSSFTIEELFFRRNIGHVTIAKVIPDMYRKV